MSNYYISINIKFLSIGIFEFDWILDGIECDTGGRYLSGNNLVVPDGDELKIWNLVDILDDSRLVNKCQSIIGEIFLRVKPNEEPDLCISLPDIQEPCPCILYVSNTAMILKNWLSEEWECYYDFLCDKSVLYDETVSIQQTK